MTVQADADVLVHTIAVCRCPASPVVRPSDAVSSFSVHLPADADEPAPADVETADVEAAAVGAGGAGGGGAAAWHPVRAADPATARATSALRVIRDE